MKAYWGSGGIEPHILDVGTRCRWVVSFATRVLYPKGKSSWYPLERRLGGPQSRFGRGREEKNYQPLPRFEHAIIQPVVQRYTTELSPLFIRRLVVKLIFHVYNPLLSQIYFKMYMFLCWPSLPISYICIQNPYFYYIQKFHTFSLMNLKCYV
jgi:hypothetical protein